MMAGLDLVWELRPVPKRILEQATDKQAVPATVPIQ